MKNSFPPVSIIQRRIGLRLSFIIGDDSLGYKIRDYSGEKSVMIPYESINMDQFATAKLVATPLFIRLFGSSVILFLMAASIGFVDRDLATLWIMIASVVLGASLACRIFPGSAFKFKIFQINPAPPGLESRTIRILDDKNADRIIAAIEAAFKVKAKRLYGTANLNNDPAKETARLDYLKNIGVLNNDELAIEILKIQRASTFISATPKDLN